jgi:hypothetical protein
MAFVGHVKRPGRPEKPSPYAALAAERARRAHNSPPPASGQTTKEASMAGRKAREPKPDTEAGEGSGISGEYSRPDAAKAFDIYDKQIAPKKAHISTLTGDCSQPWDDIKQHANFPRKVLDFVLSLEGLDDDKRDHFLLALSEGLKHRSIFLPTDIVTIADGTAGASPVPTGDASRDRTDDLLDDLAGAATTEDDFEEASDDELAAQAGRGTKTKPGTGTAAIAAMKEAAMSPGAAAH